MNRIKLNAFENAAYFWIERFVSVTADVFTKGYDEENRVKFAQLLMQKKPEEWRAIYCALAKKIEKEYIKNGFYLEFTSVGEKNHDKLNEWLSEIVNEQIPDIVLKTEVELEMQIGIVGEYGQVATKQGNLKTNGWLIFNRLTEYDENFILTGDKSYLKPEYQDGFKG